jgi:hypothetical protein
VGCAVVWTGKHGLVEVMVRGLHHRIEVSLDRIKQAPAIAHTTEPSVKNGTSVKVHWSGIATAVNSSNRAFFTSLVTSRRRWPLSLPTSPRSIRTRLSIMASGLFRLLVPGWQKWRTDQPTSAHWYRPADLRNLIAAYLSDGHDRPVRDFLAEFAGLSGTQVRKKVLVAVGLLGARLSNLVVADDVDGAKVESLLAAMRANSKPVKPERLGVIGRDHLIKAVQATGAVNADYSQEKLVTDEGLPLVVETAFGVKQDSKASRTMMIGLNWSPVFKVPSGAVSEALNACRVQWHDPVVLLIHAVQPRFAFADHGKGALVEDDE